MNFFWNTGRMKMKNVNKKKNTAIGYIGPQSQVSPMSQGATKRPIGALKNGIMKKDIKIFKQVLEELYLVICMCIEAVYCYL